MSDKPMYYDPFVVVTQKELDALRARVSELESENARLQLAWDVSEEWTRQFNDGFEAAKNGLRYDNVPFYQNDQDSWVIGYAWQKFSGLRSRVSKLEEALRHIVTVWNSIESHYAAGEMAEIATRALEDK